MNDMINITKINIARKALKDLDREELQDVMQQLAYDFRKPAGPMDNRKGRLALTNDAVAAGFDAVAALLELK